MELIITRYILNNRKRLQKGEKMPKENKTQYAILGILQGEKLTGYQICKRINKEFNKNWQEGFNSIYPSLKKLSDQGIVREIDESSKKRKITKYEVTPLGNGIFKQWLNKERSSNFVRNEELLKIYFNLKQKPDKGLKLLHQQKEKIENELELSSFKKVQLSDDSNSDSEFLNKLLIESYNHAISKAQINWCNLVINHYQKSQF